jgi:hypothetical protein
MWPSVTKTSSSSSSSSLLGRDSSGGSGSGGGGGAGGGRAVGGERFRIDDLDTLQAPGETVALLKYCMGNLP